MLNSLKRAYWAIASEKRVQRAAAAVLENQNRIKGALAAKVAPSTSHAEECFSVLAETYSGPGEYGYGDRPNWERGVSRALQLLKHCPGLLPGHRVLEVACGDGMTSVALESFGAEVYLTDLQDWRDQRAKRLTFRAQDFATAEALPATEVDLVFSYNAFEHFPNPTRALTLMLDSVRPGGHLFFEFGPLYAGPWGLHAYRALPMPFPQFLFSEDFWRARLKERGIRDLGQELDDLQPMNRWTVAQFEGLFKGSGCDVLLLQRLPASSYLDLVTRFPGSFQGRGLTIDDLTTQGLTVLLQKPK